MATNTHVTPQKKALFIAEGVTLAHVGRSIRLGSILQREGIDVELACDPRYARFFTGLDFPVRSIRSIPSDTFLDALARGRPVFSTETVRAYVSDDLSLLGSVKADVVIGDFRLSLSVSARVAGIPYVNVTNAYWSPYARPRFEVPSLALTRLVGLPLAKALFPIARPFAFALHAIPMNRARRAYQLPPLGWDLRRVYCDGDLTLYADFPELIPIFGSPPSHKYIGPVLWSPPVEPPAWWNDAIGGKACAVVCNGGSATCQQALVHGVPVVGIPSNLDQYLNMHYIERFGAGKLVRSDRASATTIRQATLHAMDDPRQRECARAAAALAKTIRPEVEFPFAIRVLLDASPPRFAKLGA